MATIKEILQMSVEQRKSVYQAKDIGVVKIDGNPFTDYKAFSFLLEKTYIKSPERSGDGSINNLNSYATFVTPHLKIDFSMMSIDSYRKIMELIYSRNEFVVECYDIVYNRTTTNKMYFATEEMPKLWAIARALDGEEYVELLGVQDYTVELIGTNAGLDKVSISYYDNNGVLLFQQEVVRGTDAVINYNFTPSGGGSFYGEWETESGLVRHNEEEIFVHKDIKLTAKVR